MKKVQSICGKILLVCVVLLLTGCGDKTPKEPFVLTEENSMEITLVNASDYPAKEFSVELEERDEWFDLLQDLGRNMEPGEVLTTRMPRVDGNIYCFSAWADEEVVGSTCCLIAEYQQYVPEGGVIVMPPEVLLNIQTIYEPGTDLETAKQTTLAQCQAVYDAKLEAQRAEEEAAEKAAEEEAKRREEERRREEEAQRLEEEKRLEKEKWERLANLSQEEADEAVKTLGYDSIEEMRTKRHSNLTATAYERESQDAFCQLYGYWYPNGDRNSLIYIAMTDEKLIWYQFDPEQGDVERGSIRLIASSGGAYKCTFTLGDGNKFTVECTSLFHELSRGTLTFKDCTKDYCDDAEYYYSKR